LARVADVASCGLLDFIEATGRDHWLGTTAVNRRGPPSLTRAELGTNGLTGWAVHVEKCRDSRLSGRPKCPKTHLCSSRLQRLWSVAWRDNAFRANGLRN